MAIPSTTRLRWIASKEPALITEFLSALKFRVQIYGAPQWNGEQWFLWVVPPDDANKDLNSVDLDTL